MPKNKKKNKFEVVYGVRWIEVEFGQRDEGYALFMDIGKCMTETRQASIRGAYNDGYVGPERPLSYVEIPFNCLEDNYQEQLKKDGVCHTENRWHPRFTGNRHYIK